MQFSHVSEKFSISLIKMIFCKNKISDGLIPIENHFNALLPLSPLFLSSPNSVSIEVSLHIKISVLFLYHTKTYPEG